MSPAPDQTITWQTSTMIRAGGNASATTNASGIANKSVSVGPLEKGQQISSSACLNGTAQCVNFTVLGARPEYAYLEPVSGSVQSLLLTGTPGQITFRVRDMNGSPMAGGTVTLYQAVFAWAPPCSPHGRCAQSPLLASETSTATSAIDGTVSFVPASIFGVATNVSGLAVSGNSSALSIAIEQHP
jgi:hypothetical protein